MEIHYDGMILFALAGVSVNGCAVWFTRDGGSLNRKAVNLHMLEDVLGWAVVLAGAVVMRFTGFALLDPILSVAVAAFILVHAVGNLKETLDIFLEKTPRDVEPEAVRERICAVEGVLEVRQLRFWSLDGQRHCADVRIAAEGEHRRIREEVRGILREYGAVYTVLELVAEGEAEPLTIVPATGHGHYHHHH